MDIYYTEDEDSPMADLLWKIIEYLQIKELFWAGAAAVFLGLLTRTEPLKPYLCVPYVRKAYFSFCFLTVTALAVPALGIIFPPQTQAAILFLCLRFPYAQSSAFPSLCGFKK